MMTIAITIAVIVAVTMIRTAVPAAPPNKFLGLEADGGVGRHIHI